MAHSPVPALADDYLESSSSADLKVLQHSIADALADNCNRRAVHAHIDGAEDLAARLWQMAAELGWLAIGLPERFGGLGLAQQGLAVLHRELGSVLAPGPYIATLAAAQWLAECDTSGFAQCHLPRVAVGELKIAVPYGPVSSTGRWHGGRTVSASGLLMLGDSSAELAVIRVRGDDGQAGLALIDTRSPAVRLDTQKMWDRTREVALLGCGDRAVSEGTPSGGNLEAELVIADPDGTVSAALARHLELATASDSLGGARSIADQTIGYMKDRVQFDRPIGAFQAMKHRAADLMILLEVQDRLLEQAVESEQRCSPDSDLWTALAAAGATDAYRFIADDCVLLHGGIGFTWEYDCHLFLKRAGLNAVITGDNAARRDRAATALEQAAREGRSVLELPA
jgi:alkylation response protein AidB-like acyl-CoA dehydrogenase